MKPVVIAYDGSEDAAGAIAAAGRLFSHDAPALVVHSFVGLSRMLLRSNIDPASGPLTEAAKEIDSADAEEAERLARAHIATTIKRLSA